MRELLPGLFHWTVRHEKIGIRVHSYYLKDARVLIDPTVPSEGLEWFERQGAPKHVLLTNRHHYRHSGRFVEAHGATVRCHRAGLHEFARGEEVEPFEHGDELPGGLRALEVGALCPEETALHLPPRRPAKGGDGVEAGVLALGDSVIRGEEDELGFVPDDYMGDDPEATKAGLRRALRRLLDVPFEHLLLAHGEPAVGGGRAELARFLEAPG